MTIAKPGKAPALWEIAKMAKIPESAPVGPTILKLLPPKMEASNPAQIAVMIPIIGVAPAATAREMERGMETRETVIPDFQLFLKLTVKKPNNFFIKITNNKEIRSVKGLLYYCEFILSNR